MMKLVLASRAGKWRLSLLPSLFFGIVLYAYVPAAYHYAKYDPANGDFIFQSLPRVDLVEAIEGATNSKYSHVGLVIHR